MTSGFSEVFKNSKRDGLSGEILLVPDDGIVLGSPVGASVEASVGFLEEFKYGNLYGTINGN